MPVTKLSITNFMGISALQVDLRPGVNEISGPNGAGKSSLIRALKVSFEGKTAAPARPIREGQELAVITTSVGPLNVTRTFRRSKKDPTDYTLSLKIERGDESMPATETALRAHIGEISVDPVRFLQLKPKDRFDLFASFVPGYDFEKADNQHRADYERRTQVNSLASDSRAAANLISVPPGTPGEPVDEAALVQQLAGAGKHNSEIAMRKARRETVAADIKRMRDFAAGVDARIEAAKQQITAQADKRINEIAAEIARLQEQAKTVAREAAQEAQVAEKELRSEGLHEIQNANELQAKLDLAGPLPEPVSVEAIEQQINEARAANAQVRKAQERAKHIQLAEKYEAESKEITARMLARLKAKQAAIAAAELPIPGLTFGDGEILLGGVPFDQANTAQRLHAALAIAIKKNPEQPFMWIEDGSLLDDKTYAQLVQLAEQHGVQVVIETVRAIGSDAILIEDGHLKEGAAEAA